MRVLREAKKEEEEKEIPIHGDLLEITLSFVSLIDLIAASCVSKSWKRAVSSSLTNFRKVKPWLFAHTQSSRTSEPLTTHAFDPRSNGWIEISHPATSTTITTHISTLLRSSTSDFLYVLSSTTLTFSHSFDNDPLHLTWRQVPGPNIHRIDPIVARVGSRIVVAGSAWEFDGDPLAVEMYEPETLAWRVCQPMPMILKDSAAATWLSVATNQREMFVTEKACGTTYAFDPRGGEWRGPFDLRPDPRAFSTAVGFAGEDNLIVASLIGHPPATVEGLGIWRVELEGMGCELISEAPGEIVESLKEREGFHRSIGLSAAEGLVYLYDPSEPETVVFCEFSRRKRKGRGSWDCVWGSAGNLVWGDEAKVGRRVVFTCGMVEIGDLKTAMRDGNRKFKVAG